MANLRTPLREINANRLPSTELTKEQRSQIITLRHRGDSWLEIAESTGFPIRTCRTTYSRLAVQRELTGNYASLPRNGRPKALSQHNKRRLLRAVRLDPYITYKTIRFEMHYPYSKSTIYRFLDVYNIKNWRAKKRPALTEEHAQLRLNWAFEHRDWTEQDWAKVDWSDECSVERGKGGPTLWVLRRPEQKWDKEMIDPMPKGKQASIIVWGCFSGLKGRTKLVIMTRDEESKRGGYSANSYCIALDEGLRDYYEPGMMFMQDNAPIHTAHKAEEWFEIHGVQVMIWPPYSPDLNPIEHI